MYPEHFGLKNRPFRAHPTGADVFVGPQTAGVLGAVKKALAVEDSVIVVSGPVGVGKSTVVRRALDAIGDNRIIISIGRLQLGYDEVIELLLAGLGARQLPKSTVQRFAVFRRLLHKYAEQGTRVFIVVEDARALGVNALAELEALTAEDAGASSGASLVLMGSAGLDELLRDPLLARLKQRIRLRHTLQPLSESELRAYLKHAFRLGGRDFEDVFEKGAAAALYRFSGGVPRVCNNIVDQALTTAVADRITTVPVSLIERTAAEEIGLTTEHSVADIKDALAQAEVDKAAAEADATADLPAAAKRDEVEVDAGPVAEPEPAPATPAPPARAASPEPDIAPVAPEPIAPPEPERAAEPVAATADAETDDDIPELIQDTLPDLEVLAPALAENPAAEEAAPVAGSAPADLDELEAALPELTLPADPAAPAAASDTDPDPQIDPVATDVRDDIPEPVGAPRAGAEIAAAKAGPSGPAEAETPVLEDLIPELDATASSAPDKPAAARIEPSPPAPEEPVDAPAAPPVLDDPVTDPAATGQVAVPDWDRDPTLAELRPDLDALERAMSFAQGSDDEPAPAAEEAPQAEEPAAVVPEITLDREIQAKIDEATEALRATETDIPTLEELEEAERSQPRAPAEDPEGNQSLEATSDAPELVEPLPAPVKEPVPAKPARDKAELDKIAADLSRARSIEDVDDEMAETLFGEEFSMIAAQIAATASANDDIELELEEADSNEATGTDGGGADATIPDTSPSQRLATLRALNNHEAPSGAPPTPEAAESIVMAAAPDNDGPQSSGPNPDSIEEQMNTSMTQTLKALNARDLSDDEPEEKKGFFSRFRRS